MPRQELDNLTNEVIETKTVMGSAVALLNNLSAVVTQIKKELADTGVSNETLNNLSDNLNTGSEELAAAIVANTPAA